MGFDAAASLKIIIKISFGRLGRFAPAVGPVDVDMIAVAAPKDRLF